MKILWASNGPHVKTGYGVQTKLFCGQRIQQFGHDVVILAFYGLQGSPIRTEEYLLLPASMDHYSNDTIAADYIDQRADVLITLMDIWVFRQEQVAKTFWAPWFPVDHDPIPPAVLRAADAADMPMVYSKFALEQARQGGVECLYVPHGVDTQAIHGLKGELARKERGIDDKLFMAGIVAANKGSPSRKAFEAQIRGFKKFHDRHPDSILYLHTETTGIMAGESIDDIVLATGIDQSCIAVVDQYSLMRGVLDDNYMSVMYSAMDVLLNATRGEGFGVPIIEAQSCGTPAIVTDFSAMPEIAYDNLLVPVKDRVYTPQGSYQAIPDADAIADLLEEVYNRRDHYRDTADSRAAWIKEHYDADVVAEQYWKPALTLIEKAVSGSPVDPKQIVEVAARA